MKFNPKIQTIAPSVLKSGNMVIEHDMDSVKVTIDGQTLTMDWRTAIKMSQLLKIHGKQAKKFAGEFGTAILTEAVLTDAELNYKRF